MCRPITLGRINRQTKCASPAAVTVNARVSVASWPPAFVTTTEYVPCGTLLRLNAADNCVNVSNVTLVAL